MNEYVKLSVDARLKLLTENYKVPEALQGEVEAFVRDITALGEAAPDSVAFEEQFNSSGLSERFCALLPRLTPIAHKLTAEEKAAAKETYREMVPKSEIADKIADDVKESVELKLESDLISAGRGVLNEAGVLDDYTRISNRVEDAGRLGKFIGNLFKKK